MDNELLNAMSDLLDKKLEPIKQEMGSIKEEIGIMKQEIGEIKQEVGLVKTQVKENTEMLKSLRHSSEVNKATLNNMEMDITHIKGSIESVKKDLSIVESVTAKNWSDITNLKAIK